MTYWSRTSLISCGVGTCVMASATSRSSSSARISLQSAMHSLQMYTEGPEMNFRTESFDLPQNEQRRCLSCDMAETLRGAHTRRSRPGRGGYRELTLGPNRVKQRTTGARERFHEPLVPVIARALLDRRCLRGNHLRIDQIAAARDHVVDDPVALRFLGRHEEVAHHVALDLLQRTAGVLAVNRVELMPEEEDLLRLNLDVGRRP